MIAYVTLRIADVKPEDRVLDAFCGGGTIIIEAAQVWDNIDLLRVDSLRIELKWLVLKCKSKIKWGS